MARSKKQICWVVAHPEIGTAFVTADSWGQATVAAADFWGVPWGKYVAGMELRQKKAARRHLCCRCGRIFHSPGDLCEACIKILHTGPTAEKDVVSGRKGQRLRCITAPPEAGREGV